ncbi:hypothetical protein D5R93_09255 [Actinomyces lilanjuaniae]|uniref:ParB/Sulfiredoxin domain-containing protein n=2 Tax=Actinomyces lilanjuaniae TaxID=2321394 RepID=A0ABM6Z490_9ACTO|nr:hypothetical protein D5R93_09255 [Actinomyces lilanjuaniae]
MSRLLAEFGDEITALARSIAHHGLDPTQSWAVVEEQGQVVVLEGNRRLTACRLLERPSRAPTPDWVDRFRRISSTATTDDSYQRPNCVLFDRRADARYWIQIKHHGRGAGEGTAPWGPEMVYLDQLNNGGEPEGWNEFWYWLEEAYRPDPQMADLVNQARRKQYTTMKRVYDWKVKELLNAELGSDGTVHASADPQKIRPFIEALLTGMLPTGARPAGSPPAGTVISSRTLNDQETASNTLKCLWNRTIGQADVTADYHARAAEPGDTQKRPAPTGSPPSPAGAAAPGGETSHGHPSSTAQDAGDPFQPDRTSRPRNHDRPRKGETHLYADVRRASLPGRLREMLKECSDLKIDDHPQVCAVMARVTLELAVDALINHHHLTVKNQKNRLVDKLKVVLRHLDPHYDAKEPGRPELGAHGPQSSPATSKVSFFEI